MNTSTRVTRECTFDQLEPSLITAIQNHETKYGLGSLEPEILMCCETNSSTEKSGLFGKSTDTILSAVFLTPQWLVWASGRDGAGSAQLKHIDVHDYADSAMFAISPEFGLNITGRYTNHNQTGQVFIRLDSGPVGQKFRALLYETLEKIKPK